MRNLVVLIHVIWIVVFTFLVVFKTKENWGLEVYLLMVCVYIPPFVTLYYLYTHLEKEENLISLWIKVRKKRLKDELEK